MEKESHKEENHKEENHKEENHREHKHKKRDYTSKIRQNPWILSTITLIIVVMIIIVISGYYMINGDVVKISEEDVRDLTSKFLSSQNADGATIEDISFKDGIYVTEISYQNQSIPIYLTADGKNFILQLVPVDMVLNQKDNKSSKSDKPKVELFVMTHCPYGTQAEKGFIPAIKEMGDLIDAKIRFVHYFMHDDLEEVETPIQVCIREEQGDKFLSYLECFLEDGNSTRCIAESQVDENKLNECISSGRADTYYEQDSNLSEGYGIKGSPGIVINGKEIRIGRDSASYFNAICSSFNTAPEICNSVTLSNETPSAGFGYPVTGSNNPTGSCS